MITQDILPRSAGVKVNAHGLVVFDLDGTLLRGQTVCEVLAAPLGRLDEMNTGAGIGSPVPSERTAADSKGDCKCFRQLRFASLQYPVCLQD
jgi:phosphoserine phosphatase